MKKKTNVADVVKSVAKSKVVPLVEIDKTGWIHVTIPEYNSWIKVFLNDKPLGKGIFQLHEGKVSIQLSGPLPYEHRVRVEVLKKN